MESPRDPLNESDDIIEQDSAATDEFAGTRKKYKRKRLVSCEEIEKIMQSRTVGALSISSHQRKLAKAPAMSQFF